MVGGAETEINYGTHEPIRSKSSLYTTDTTNLDAPASLSVVTTVSFVRWVLSVVTYSSSSPSRSPAAGIQNCIVVA